MIYSIGQRTHQLDYKDFVKDNNSLDFGSNLIGSILINQAKITADVSLNRLILVIAAEESAYSYTMEVEFGFNGVMNKENPQKV